MVLDGIAVASTVISLMVNGLCCLWQQQEEQKLREAIRHDVRTEYWHHRRSMDLQTPIDPDDMSQCVLDTIDIMHIQEERRKKLMIAKMNVMQQRSHVQDDTFSKSNPHVVGPMVSHGTSFHKAEGTVRDSATPPSRNKILDCITTFRNQSTSLLDNCDTEDDDLEDIQSTSFVDVNLD
jgi:hypothetical protein